MDRVTGPDGFMSQVQALAGRNGHSQQWSVTSEGQPLPIICTGHHVLLIDQMDTVNGAPREKECVRDKVQPSHQPLEPRHATADCLTGGHRRQAGIPLESSTHAQSHPGPQLSHSTLGSGHPMQPQHPGAQSWREEESVTCELREIREPAFTCYLPERTHRVST